MALNICHHLTIDSQESNELSMFNPSTLTFYHQRDRRKTRHCLAPAITAELFSNDDRFACGTLGSAASSSSFQATWGGEQPPPTKSTSRSPSVKNPAACAIAVLRTITKRVEKGKPHHQQVQQRTWHATTVTSKCGFCGGATVFCGTK